MKDSWQAEKKKDYFWLKNFVVMIFCGFVNLKKNKFRIQNFLFKIWIKSKWNIFNIAYEKKHRHTNILPWIALTVTGCVFSFSQQIVAKPTERYQPSNINCITTVWDNRFASRSKAITGACEFLANKCFCQLVVFFFLSFAYFVIMSLSLQTQINIIKKIWENWREMNCESSIHFKRRRRRRQIALFAVCCANLSPESSLAWIMSSNPFFYLK